MHQILLGLDTRTLVSSVNQFMENNRDHFAGPFIKSEVEAARIDGELALLYELKHSDPTQYQENPAHHVSLNLFLYRLKHKYYDQEEKLTPEDRAVLSELMEGYMKIQETVESAKLAGLYEIRRERLDYVLDEVAQTLKEMGESLQKYEEEQGTIITGSVKGEPWGSPLLWTGSSRHLKFSYGLKLRLQRWYLMWCRCRLSTSLAWQA